jgi:hypothetical protein
LLLEGVGDFAGKLHSVKIQADVKKEEQNGKDT